MEKCFLEQKECIVLGDFNVDIYKPVGSSRVWLELMEFNYSQLVYKPTRISLHSSTLMNHIFSNAPNIISSISVPHYSISDHLPFCLTRMSDKGSAHKYIRYRKTEQFDDNAFLSDLVQQSCSNINSYEDPSTAVLFFNDTFLFLLDKHAPLKKKRVKKGQQPGWMNQENLNSIKTRDKFHNQKDMNNYKIWRNKVKSFIFRSKQDFFNDAINSNVKNPKKLWAGTHEHTALKSNSATNHIQDKDGNIIKNAYSATNKFNEHFCRIHKVFKDPTESPSDIDFSRLEYMTQRKLNNQHISIPYIICDFVYSQLIQLDIFKSTGSDQISAKFLKMAAPIIAPALTQIFNPSISKVEFTSPLKLARVVPIHKNVPD